MICNRVFAVKDAYRSNHVHDVYLSNSNCHNKRENRSISIGLIDSTEQKWSWFSGQIWIELWFLLSSKLFNKVKQKMHDIKITVNILWIIAIIKKNL